MMTSMEKLCEILKIQGTSGNWNYDEYQLGMYNGLALAFSIFAEKEPEFKLAPKKYLKNRKRKNEPTKSSK